MSSPEKEEEEGGGGGTDVDEEEELSVPKSKSMITKDAAYWKYHEIANKEGFALSTIAKLLLGISRTELPFWRMMTHGTSVDGTYDTYTLEPGMRIFTGCVASVTNEHVLSRANWFSSKKVSQMYGEVAKDAMHVKLMNLRIKGKIPQSDLTATVREFIVFRSVTVLAVDSCRTINYLQERISKSSCARDKKSLNVISNHARTAYDCDPVKLPKFNLRYPAHMFRMGVVPEERLGSYVVPIRTSETSVDNSVSTCMCKFRDVNGHASLGFPAKDRDGTINEESPFHPEVFLCDPASCLLPTETILSWVIENRSK
jgi:hypothetical protein